MKVTLTEKAWTSLSRKLELDHEKPGSSIRAVETIMGWISQLGPCFKTTDINKAYARIGLIAHDLAFDELPSVEEIHQNWQLAHKRWRQNRIARMKHQEELSAAPPSGHSEPAGTPRAGQPS